MSPKLLALCFACFVGADHSKRSKSRQTAQHVGASLLLLQQARSVEYSKLCQLTMQVINLIAATSAALSSTTLGTPDDVSHKSTSQRG